MEARHKVKFEIRGNKDKRIHGTLSLQELPSELQELFDDGPQENNSNQTQYRADEQTNVVIRPHNMTSLAAPPSHMLVEADPKGASTYVIAVILIYGISIILLIASQLFIRKKEFGQNSEKQIIRYLEQAPILKVESEKESFKLLKTSLIPMIARSPSGRALIAKRLKYAPYLKAYLPSDGLTTEQQSDPPTQEQQDKTPLWQQQTTSKLKQTSNAEKMLRFAPPHTGDPLLRYSVYTLRHTDSESEFTDGSSDMLDHEARMEDILEVDDMSGRETMV